MKTRKGFRPIVVDGIHWQYKIGLSNVVAYRFFDGEKRLIAPYKLAGYSNPDSFDKDRRKGSRYLIGPKQVSEWLRK